MFQSLGKRSLTLLLGVLLFVMPSHGAITYAYYNQQPKISLWSLRKRPLIVWIHGRRQTERKFVEFSQIVEKTQLLDPLIIAPEIESSLNPVSTRFIEISGMSHRWSGNKSGSAFSSPNTQSAIDSFLKLTSQLD